MAGDPRGWPTAPGRPVRVAIVITRLDGGAGVLALRGALAVQAGSCAPVIVAGSGALVADAVTTGLEVLIEPALRAPISPRSDVRVLRRLEALFAERGFDVVHTHCAKAGAVGRLAARRAGVRRIVHTYHGFPFHEFQSRGRRAAYTMIERLLGRITDVALCVGAGVAAEAVRRELIAPERIRTIGVTVDGPDRERAVQRAFSPDARDRARRSLGLPASGTIIGAVGRLTYQKAPEDFVAAVARLRRPDVTAVWVGGGELAARVARTARAMPEARVVLAGERSDVLDVLPAFDVFALPSRYEGLPTAVVEAMICGIPVVATAVNAVPDLVVPGETGLLVPPGRPDLMAAAIGHLLDSPADAARMAACASARMAGRYTESALRDTLAAAYAAESAAGGTDTRAAVLTAGAALG